jgi:hypothetical protein
MFRALAAAFGPPALGGPVVFRYHPMQLSRFLEEVWINRPNPGDPPTGLHVPAGLVGQEAYPAIAPRGTPSLVAPDWNHLIYAYMIENTRAYEVFRRVVEEYAYGERLGTPTNTTQRWLRTTEQLFYSDHPPFQIYSFTSWIRPDLRAARRNAYFRMFGMDLNHGTDDNRPYPYPRPAASNTEFAPTFEQLLREVWRGIENFTNTSGPTPIDQAAIANLATRLDDMLGVRRNGGNLRREELAHVSTMSWFHLTLSFNSSIVNDLEAQADSPEDRLFKIGERVGLPAHSRSAAYFRLADDMSLILRLIELGQFNNPTTAQALYQPAPPAPNPTIFDAMRGIIRDWSVATGRDMKTRPVSVAPPQPRPIRPPATPIVSAPRVARPPRTAARPRRSAAGVDGRAELTRETLSV